MSNLQDISKKQLLSSLEKKSKDIESILYSMSHDLRGPVTTILGLNNIINEESSKEELKQYLEIIHKLALDLDQKMANTVELLSVTNLDTQKTEVNPKQLFESIVIELSSTDDNYSFSIDHSGDDIITVEKEVMYHSIKNLLDCVYSYTTSSEKQIQISSQATPQLLKLKVVSNIKLKRETYDTLRKILNGTSKTYSNLGMKLHLAKIYLRRLNGEIIFTPGKSTTTINVMIPLKSQIELDI